METVGITEAFALESFCLAACSRLCAKKVVRHGRLALLLWLQRTTESPVLSS